MRQCFLLFIPALLSGLMAATLADAALPAATADDICLPAADPCVINSVFDVADNAVLDFGTRAVEIAAGGQLRTGADGMTIECGSFRVDARAKTLRAVGPGGGLARRGGFIEIVSFGTCSNDASIRCLRDFDCGAGACDFSQAFVDIQSRITSTGEEPGDVLIDAAGDIVIGGAVNVSAKGRDYDGGRFDLLSYAGSVVVSGKIRARGGGRSTGGDVSFDAGQDVTVTGNIDVAGGDLDGGYVDIFGLGHVRVERRISASARSGEGFGGQVSIKGDASVTIGPRARISTNGHGVGDFGGDAGLQDYESIDGDVVLEPGSVIKSLAGRQDGWGDEVVLDADGSVVIAGKILMGARGDLGDGGTLVVASRGSISILPSAKIRNRGANGGDLDLYAGVDLNLDGDVRIRSSGTEFRGFVLIEAVRRASINGSFRMSRGRDEIVPFSMDLNLFGCEVVLGPSALVELIGPQGITHITAASSLRFEAGSRLLADQDTGSHFITLAPNPPAPVVAGLVVPGLIFSIDPTLDPLACGCGDGVLAGTEECDDGDANSDVMPDACRNDCTLAACGDDVVDSGEICDDGNLVSDDGCDVNCTPTGCGNGHLNTGEECDDGAGNSDTLPDGCRTDCSLAGCGDDVLDTGEICDDGNLISDDGCDPNCTPTGCGNGYQGAGEQCDDGAGNSDTAPDACRTDCSAADCGDLVIDSAEQCDDGAANSDVSTDACRENCALPACGDDVIDSGETCDDGNLVSDDGCDANCAPTGCGNDIVTSGEECDDGNLLAGDGCSEICECEAGFPCISSCPGSVEIEALGGVGAPCTTNADCPADYCDPGLGRCATATRYELGWTGIAHDNDAVTETALRLALDCGGTIPCGECTILGVDPEPGNCRCANDIGQVCDEPFAADADDCGGATCNCYLSPPRAMSAGNTPLCTIPRLREDVVGTIDVDTGARSAAIRVADLLHLGINLVLPCPACGGVCTAPAASVGDRCAVDIDCDSFGLHDGVCGNYDSTPNDGVAEGTCIGGANKGLSCDVHGLQSSFPAPGPSKSGPSFDCPPDAGKNISGTGLKADYTQTTARAALPTASITCGFPPFVSYLCPCGTCSNDTRIPCSGDADCSAGGVCEMSGSGAPLPDQCTTTESCLDVGDGFGECAVGPTDRKCDGIVRANGEGFIGCIGNSDCELGTIGLDAGACTLSLKRACFLDPVTADGLADPNLPIVTSAYCRGRASGDGVNTVLGAPGPDRLVEQQMTTFYCANAPNVEYVPGVGGCP